MILMRKPEKDKNGYLKIDEDDWQGLINLILDTRSTICESCRRCCKNINANQLPLFDEGPISRSILDIAEAFFIKIADGRATLLINNHLLKSLSEEIRRSIGHGDVLATPYGNLTLQKSKEVGLTIILHNPGGPEW